ncbi:hypothetical protein CC2G_015312 [Coprinopsis cinerea AmutBmut pab1-1]|nr:hypothetical protein CC2G_015312 [Coprinopsis cinerea AmutBmut pab1-1]
MAPNRQHRSLNDPTYEERLQKAMEALRNGEITTRKEAAATYDVSVSTLNDRMSGRHQSRATAYQHRCLLAPSEDKAVRDQVSILAAQGRPPDRNTLRGIVYDVTGKLPGKNWDARWCERNDISRTVASGLDPKRAQNFRPENVNEFFDLLLGLNEQFGQIPPQHIFNMDEKGVQLGGGRKGSGKIWAFPRFLDRKYRYTIQNDNLEMGTIHECVSAAGETVPVSFVIKGDGRVPTPDSIKYTFGSISTSENGWTDNEIATRWFKEVFVPFAMSKRVDNTKPIILIMDGHESHESRQLKNLVYEMMDTVTIIILCFPSKCTHKMQPLDVVVFSPLQRKWKAHVDNLAAKGYRLTRYSLVNEYLAIRATTVTPDLIKESFRKTGIYPYNRNVFTDADFAPNQAFDSQASLGDSYPEEFPSSDLAIPSDAEWSEDEDGEDYNPFMEINNLPTRPLNIDVTSDSEESEGDEEDEEDEVSPDSSLLSISTRSTAVHFTIQEAQELDKVVSLAEDEAKSPAQLIEELRDLRKNFHILTNTATHLDAQLKSANAHCTIAKRRLDDVSERLHNATIKKPRTMKLKESARFATHPDLEKQWAAIEAENVQRDEEEKARQVEKDREAAEREKRIEEMARTHVFDKGLNSYKTGLKHELQAIARAFSLSETGNKEDIFIRIKDYLDSHPERANEHRFAGLFSQRRGGRPRSTAATYSEPTGAQLESHNLAPHFEHRGPSYHFHQQAEAGPSTLTPYRPILPRPWDGHQQTPSQYPLVPQVPFTHHAQQYYRFDN